MDPWLHFLSRSRILSRELYGTSAYDHVRIASSCTRWGKLLQYSVRAQPRRNQLMWFYRRPILCFLEKWQVASCLDWYVSSKFLLSLSEHVNHRWDVQSCEAYRERPQQHSRFLLFLWNLFQEVLLLFWLFQWCNSKWLCFRSIWSPHQWGKVG